MPSTVLCILRVSNTNINLLIGTIIKVIFQMRKLRLRELEILEKEI